VEPSVNQKTIDYILAEFRSKDWSDLELSAGWMAFCLSVMLLAFLYRWWLHRRRLAHVRVQFNRWAETFAPSLLATPVAEQLGTISLLRDVSGHPAYVPHLLVAFGVQVEQLNVDPSVLAAFDQLAEERQHEITESRRRRGRRNTPPKTNVTDPDQSA